MVYKIYVKHFQIEIKMVILKTYKDENGRFESIETKVNKN